MSLSVGIVGLPNVGKSTLFTALTKNEVLIANYPFATIDPSVGVVAVPDGRLASLAAISGTATIIPAVVERDVLARLKPHLAGGNLANALPMTEDELKVVKGLHLLTMKPFLYVCNKKTDAFNLDEQNDDRWIKLVEFFERTVAEYVVVDAGMEHELSDLSDEEKNDFRREYGAQGSGVESLIRACYNRLGLMSYFTTGEKETRDGTAPIGSTRPTAAAP